MLNHLRMWTLTNVGIKYCQLQCSVDLSKKFVLQKKDSKNFFKTLTTTQPKLNVGLGLTQSSLYTPTNPNTTTKENFTSTRKHDPRGL